MSELSIVYKNVKDLTPYKKNARTHSKQQVSRIADSIKEFGFSNPIIVDENNVVMAGHGRLMAAKKLKMESVPTIQLKDMTEQQKKAYILADNKLALDAGWDEDLLKIELQELQSIPEIFDVIGFGEKELKDLGIIDFDPLGVEIEDPDISDTEIQTYREDIVFPSDNEFDIPSLREDMLYTGSIDDVCFGVKDEIDPLKKYLCLFGQHDIKQTAENNVIGFFVDDSRFEKVWTNAVKYIKDFLKIRPAAIMTPNFSIWSDDPMPMQLLSWYKTQWCGRYWQEAGLKVLPTINWGSKKTYKFCFAGIPKYAPIVACQCRNIKTKEEQALFVQGLVEAHRQIEFQKLICYGENIEVFDDILKGNGIDFTTIISWSKKKDNAKIY